MSKDKASGIYSLCVRFEDDNRPYMVGFSKKGDDKVFYKVNLELIDEFTSNYVSKEALFQRIQKSIKSGRKPIDAFILYKRAQTNTIDDNTKEVIPTVRKLDVIINDKNIHEICRNYVDDKYVENSSSKLNGEDDNIKSIFNQIVRNVENEKGFNRIKDDVYLSQYAAHFKEKLLDHGLYYLNARSKETSNTYPVAKDALLSSYSTFRHVYTHLIRTDVKDATIYSTKSPIIKETNSKVTATKVDVKKEQVDVPQINDYHEIAKSIENPYLRELYIAYEGNPNTLFEYIITAYVGDEAGVFLNKLSYNDQVIAFGDYDIFLEKCQSLWPDMFSTRRL